MSQKTELSVVNRNTATLAASVVQVPATSLMADTAKDGDYLFSFNPANPENEELVFACDGNASREWAQHVAEPFLLWHWAVKRISLTDQDTEQTFPHLRLVLIDPDGETLAFVSTGVVQSLDLIRTLRGDGPYVPPIPVVVSPVKTRLGFQTLKLRILHQPKADKTKSK